MLYQPSNIMPSTFAGVGGGTVAASDAVEIVWQINGNSPMAAFCIDFFKNDTGSSPIFSTGVITEGCPVFGNDSRGNSAFFSWCPELTWGDLGIIDGNSYKFKITSFWRGTVYRYAAATVLPAGDYFISAGAELVSFSLASDLSEGGRLLYNPRNRSMACIANDRFYAVAVSVSGAESAGSELECSLAEDLLYISQYSDSVLMARSVPTLEIADFSPVVSNVRKVFSAFYAQAQGDAVDRVRWQFAERNGDTREVLDDTGWVNTGILWYEATGLLNKRDYSIVCSVVSQSGVEISTGWMDFSVSYEQSKTDGAVEVECRADGSTLLSWEPATVIAGTADPSDDFGTFRGGSLRLNDGASVRWDTVDGEPMHFPSPFTLGWKGSFADISTYLSSLSAEKIAFYTDRIYKPNGMTCFSPDGQLCALALDSYVYLFWVIDGALHYRERFSVLGTKISGMIFDGNGTSLMVFYHSYSNNWEYTQFYLSDGTISKRKQLNLGHSFYQAECAPLRGDFMITSSGSALYLDELDSNGDPTGNWLLIDQGMENWSVAVNDEGSMIAITFRSAAAEKTMVVYQVMRNEDGTILSLSEVGQKTSESPFYAVSDISFSADGRYLAFYAGQTVEVFFTEGGQLSPLYEFDAPWNAPDTRNYYKMRVLFCGANSLVVYRPYIGLEHFVVSDDGASSRGVVTEGEVSYLSASSAACLMVCDGMLYRVSDRKIRELDAISGDSVFPTSALTVAHHPSGNLAVVGGFFAGYAALYAVSGDTYTFLGSIERGSEALNGLVCCAAFSTDGTRLILGGYFSGFASVFAVAQDSVTYLGDVTRGGEALDGVVTCARFVGSDVILGGGFHGFASVFAVEEDSVDHVTDLLRGEMKLTSNVYTVSAADGLLILGGSNDGEVSLFSETEGEYSYISDLSSVDPKMVGVTFASAFIDGETAIIGGEYGVYLISLAGKSIFSTSRLSFNGTDIGTVRTAAVSSDGNFFAIGGESGYLYSRGDSGFGCVFRYMDSRGMELFSSEFVGDRLLLGGSLTEGIVSIYRLADIEAQCLSAGEISISVSRNWLSVFGFSEPIVAGVDEVILSISPTAVVFSFFGGGERISEAVHSHSRVLPPIESVVLQGAQVCDWVYLVADEYDFSSVSYQPKRTSNTYFFADFVDGDLQAGTSSASSVRNSVYRLTEGASRAKLLFDAPTSIHQLRDYGGRSMKSYLYQLFYVTGDAEDSVYSSPAVSPSVGRRFTSYFLYETEEDADYPNVYHVKNAWRFGNNIDGGSISNNNQPNWLTNFTPYRLRQTSSLLGKSGTLQALLSNAVDGKYSDTADMMEELFAASGSNNTFFLKDMKGNLYMVQISAPITQTIATASPTQPVSISVPWEEVGDADDVSLILLPTDAYWYHDVDRVDEVVLDVDPFTGSLSALYPENYRGTVFSLDGERLVTSTPDGLVSPRLSLDGGKVTSRKR